MCAGHSHSVFAFLQGWCFRETELSPNHSNSHTKESSKKWVCKLTMKQKINVGEDEM
jgi:hypothetical protein